MATILDEMGNELQEPGYVIDPETGLAIPNMPGVGPVVQGIDAGLEAVANATTPIASTVPESPDILPGTPALSSPAGTFDAAVAGLTSLMTPIARPGAPQPVDQEQQIGPDGFAVGPVPSSKDTGFRYPTSTTVRSNVREVVEGPKTTVSQKEMTPGTQDALTDMETAEATLANAAQQQQKGIEAAGQVDIEKEQRRAKILSAYEEAKAEALAQEAQEVEMEMSRLDAKIQELANTPREDFWGSKTEGQKIAAALSVGLGSFGQALTGSGQNVGMAILNSRIDQFNRAQDEKFDREIKRIEGMRANMATKRELAKTAREGLAATKEAALLKLDEELAQRAGLAKTQQQVAQIAQQSSKIQADLANARAGRYADFAQNISVTREDKTIKNLQVKGIKKRGGGEWAEADKKTLNFYNRMANSQNEIEAIGGDQEELRIARSPAYGNFMKQFQMNTQSLQNMNLLGTNIGKVGAALSNMKSFQELKKQDPGAAAYVLAQIPFIMGKLRKDTGAVISVPEFWNEMETYFPLTQADEREIRNKITRRRDQLAGELDTLDVDIVE